jgi:hypothetical protein
MDNTAGQSEQELKLPARCEGGSEKPSVGSYRTALSLLSLPIAPWQCRRGYQCKE